MKQHWIRRAFAIVVAALGAPMVVGGIRLLAIGGSAYYVVAGAALIASGALLWRGNHWGRRLYAAVFAASTLWALMEIGLRPWALLGRIGLLGVLGVGIFLAGRIWHTNRSQRVALARTRVTTFALLFGAVVALIVASVVFGPGSGDSPARRWITPATSTSDWAVYGGTPAGTHFSALRQITADNVAGLQPAWTFRNGEFAAAGSHPIDSLGALKGLYGGSALEATPVAIGGTLYTCTELNMVIALDGETGTELWRFNPRPNTKLLTHSSCRGVAYHEQSGSHGPCTARILHGSIDGRLWALDARTGTPCTSFGDKGSISLREGLSEPDIGYHMTSPGTIARNLVIVGAWIPDNQSVREPSGVIRAYDVITGQLAWAWDVGAPDRLGAPAPGSTYTPGTPNMWSLASVDEALNLVYVPTGNATPDIWGGKRRPFDDQYSSSVVALDLTTGRPRWSFQTVHHDLWDYDVPAQPVLVDLPIDGAIVPALVQPTKSGDIFVLDRRTGDPIVPVVERLVPQGPAPGDYLSPTQPFSELSVRGPELTEAQMWGITPLDQLWCRIRFREARYEGLYTPPGERPTINYPGSFGAISWGGVAIDLNQLLMVSNHNSVAYYMQLIPRDRAPESARERRDPTSYEWLPMERTPYVVRIKPFLSPLDIPCNEPPWGRLEAIDLRTGRTIWRRVFGTARDSGPLGHATGLPVPIGAPAQGGAISTAGGLTFIAASADNYLRAFDTRTGTELWRGRLPAGGQATPMTYISPTSGRQFVVVSAGGHPALRTTRGDYLIAYALPARTKAAN